MCKSFFTVRLLVAYKGCLSLSTVPMTPIAWPIDLSTTVMSSSSGGSGMISISNGIGRISHGIGRISSVLISTRVMSVIIIYH
ncbi:hypothetical protein BDF14DRAFT_1806176 [Spinellus fusiger]|nr:hypothetical protein BDF14DRAFT_1806176 [Spinellus fusiger]